MSYLIAKSKQNIQAANYLINGVGYYASSVHCSYYSCIQLMMEIISKKLGQDMSQFKNMGTSSHVTATNIIFHHLVATEFGVKASSFKRKIGTLKRTREDSDYHEVKIDEPISSEAYKQAVEINTLLKEHYQLN